MKLHSLWTHVRAKPYAWLTGLLLCASSYLCLVNLDYSLLWEDEANTAIIGNNLLNTGTLTAWDGRNLASTRNGLNLNSNAHEVLPPLQYVFSAIGISILGYNEIGARSVHALLGVLTLIMFLMLLKQHFPDSPRLRFLIFLFVTLSPQLLLYFRSARYFSFAVFSFIACFYFYEQYWRGNRYRHLISMTIFGLLGFLNNYSMGAAGILSIAIYHLILRPSGTNKKQWLMFGVASLFIILVGGSWLYAHGVIQLDHDLHGFYGITESSLLDYIMKFWWGIISILGSDWLSWSVCLWLFVYWKFRSRKINQAEANYFAQSCQIILMGLLFVFLSILLSPHDRSYLRMSISAMPLLLVMKGLFIYWLIRKSKFMAGFTLVVLLFSSVGAAPLNLIHAHTGESTHGFWLLSFIREIHRPYQPDPILEISRHLTQHAHKDDLVYVSDAFGYRENMIPYIGDHILLCCQIDKNHHRLAKQVAKMRPSLFYDRDIIPDWIVIFYPNKSRRWNNLIKHVYHQNWSLHNIPVFTAQTQRPELDMHSFEPYPKPRHGGIHILKRKENASNTWF